jgi:hypothetical protein
MKGEDERIEFDSEYRRHMHDSIFFTSSDQGISHQADQRSFAAYVHYLFMRSFFMDVLWDRDPQLADNNR